MEPARPAKNLSARRTLEFLFPSERACRALLSLHGNNNRGVFQPECDLRYQRCVKNHQESSQNKQEHHSPTKRNAVAYPRSEPGLSAHWTQSGGQPTHLSLLPSTGSGKPSLKHLFQETFFFPFSSPPPSPQKLTSTTYPKRLSIKFPITSALTQG